MSRLACVVGWIVAFATLSTLSGRSQAWAGSCPNLAIVVDRSSSMLNTLAGTPPMAGEQSRWQIVRDAVGTLLNQYDGKLPLGISFFPRPGSTCGTSSFAVAPAYGSKAAILAALDSAESTPSTMALTPTCGAIDSVAADPAMRDAARAQYVVLLTDGRPLCSSSAGCTCDACNSLGAVNAAIASLRMAREQSPSIHTFVIGLGASLDASDKQSLNDMASEGGEANPDASADYYAAESAAALGMQLDRIARTVTGAGAGSGASVACDDSCYSQGCPAGKICLQSVCSSNPCDGMNCPDGQYCYSTGTTASCIAPCAQSCGSGSRCIRGSCAEDPCGMPCSSGRKCDPGSKGCQSDPACSNVTCKLSQACQAGKCIDDPCLYLQCPQGLSCVPFEGTCAPSGDGSAGRGCSCQMRGEPQPSHRLAMLVPLWLMGAVYLARRRRATRDRRQAMAV